MKILAFAPHSQTMVHAFPEALIVESLKQAGHEIHYITCGGVFKKFCVCMSAVGLNAQSAAYKKLKTCLACHQDKKFLRSEFGFNQGDDLTNYLEQTDFRQAASILKSVSRDSFQTLMMDGISIGLYAAYELLLHNKKTSLNFTDSEWTEYLIALENTILSLLSFKKIFHQVSPDRVLIYSPQYSVNHCCAKYAEIQNVDVYFLEGGTNLSERLSTLRIWKWNAVHLINPCLLRWEKFRNHFFPREDLKRVTNHFLSLLEGHFYGIYSSKKSGVLDIYKHFKIPSTSKIMLATMSSYDEAFAAYVIGLFPKEKWISKVFPTQRDWIKALCEFMKSRPDLFLIVRVHPRDFPNTRDARHSEQAQLLMAEFKDFPDNVRVNWPSEGISLYDLAEHISVLLTGWSITALEMGLLGIPIVTYDQALPSYPADLTFTGDTRDDFFNNIDKALAVGWTFEQIVKSYRWWAINFTKNVINISESFQYSDSKRPSLRERILRRLLGIFRLSGDYFRYQYCKSRADRLNAAGAIQTLVEGSYDTLMDLPSYGLSSTSAQEEYLAVREETRLLLRSFYAKETTASKQGSLRWKFEHFFGESFESS